MKKLSLKRIILLSALAVALLFFICLGVVFRLMGVLWTPALLLSFFVIPVVAFALACALIFLKFKPVLKVVLSIVLAAGFILSTFVSLMGRFEMLTSYENEEVSESYGVMAEVYPLMPSLDSVGAPIGIEYHEYFTMTAAPSSSCTCIALICQYTEEAYAEQEALLEEEYTFSQEQTAMFGCVFESVTEIDGYSFRICTSGEGSAEQGEDEFVMIAANGGTNEIVYISFFAEDPNGESAYEIINDDCGWKRMRQK
ncbi:MAG: hypothetical protein IJ011_03630 [Clostridia bacterium]|nr:hypothetical protein [Clostridia bacterium]